jgi:hypothetical protein
MGDWKRSNPAGPMIEPMNGPTVWSKMTDPRVSPGIRLHSQLSVQNQLTVCPYFQLINVHETIRSTALI